MDLISFKLVSLEHMEPDWIARGIAGISLLIASINTAIVIITLRRSSARQQPNLVAQIIRWSIVYSAGGTADYLLLEVTISNLSDVGNSVVGYGLAVGPPYNDSTGPVEYNQTPLGETVLLPSAGSTFTPDPLALRKMRLKHLSNPVNVPPHESNIGWISFPLPSVPPHLVKGFHSICGQYQVKVSQ